MLGSHGLLRLASIVAAITLAAPLASARKADTRPTVALLYFDHAGTDAKLNVLRKGLADMLIADLSSMSSIRIVERERLQKLLNELKLNRSTKFDRRTANRIGKLLGARYIVFGSYFSLYGQLCINTAVTRVETSGVVPSARICGANSDFLALEQKLAARLRTSLAKHLKRVPRKRPRHRPRVRRKRAKKRPRLTTKTALRYARALDAKDRGRIATARAELRRVLKSAPAFELAARTLARLVRRKPRKPRNK